MLMVLAHMSGSMLSKSDIRLCRSKDVCNGFPNEALYNGRTSHSSQFCHLLSDKISDNLRAI
jgi:hypothetical protein